MRLLALLLFAALTAFGADVAGKWKATYQSQDGPRDVTFVFQVHDGKLSGTATGPHGETPITEGTVEGDKINFTVATDSFKAVLTGTVSGDEMKLSAAVGDQTIDLPAKRVKE
jgi:hypothetical protein